MRGRGIAMGLALLFLVTGCGGVVNGTAAPDPAVVKLPKLTADKIPDMLLTPDETGKIVASSKLVQKFENTVPTVPKYTYSPPDCGSLLYSGDKRSYGDTWTGYRLRSYQEPGDDYDHNIFQAVTTYKNFVVAEDLVAKYRAFLASCKDSDVTNTSTETGKSNTTRVTAIQHNSDPSAVSVDWVLTSKSNKWFCSNTIRTVGNAVIETASCATADARTAAIIADKIAAKIKQQH
ncbi:sensor domain-containing protein [Nocardia yamanashiensis]|uniref:sensor domain-containing protein n=1 Tax=Nocardia yamanashiensis TaxID=209247 RepID=UPI00082C3A13|nr:sensor domain-containing protein [Nocardia yamanashiensis]UGT38877.1 sensor domain-containing protein [Nocardia yamanashiensis]